jgi:adenine-specific DNA-methyltransferase
MIYIDPPYNTGNNLIYKNDFSLNVEEYKSKYEYFDESNNFFNNKSNSRFHTDWLNIIYPVLILAKNLLTDDGGICVAIDHNELHNLTKLLDEVFGETNKIGLVTVVHKPEGRNQEKHFSTSNEFALFYSKNIKSFKLNKTIGESNYDLQDQVSKYKLNPLMRVKDGRHFEEIKIENFNYPIFVSSDLNEIKTEKFKDSISVFPVSETGRKFRWRFIKQSLNNLINNNEIVALKNKKNNIEIFQKVREDSGTIVKTHWIDKNYNAISYGTKVLDDIMKVKTFDFPKSLLLMKDIVSLISDKDSIVLDFFSGSATTAHAVMQLNAEDGGNRKFIMVQLPEKTSDDSEAYKAGYKNICEIGKERIRRAGELVKKDLIEKNSKLNKDEEKVDHSKLDIGFKVFKLDESNFKEWDSSKEPTVEQIELFADPIKEGKSEEEVLYEVLLKYGVFDQEVKKLKINNKDIYSISDNYLVIMLSNKIEDKDIEEIKKLKPKVVIFRDSGFNGNDTVKINAFYNLTKSGVEEVKTV